jgi:Na+-driven multidrug efflux pump
MEVLNVIDERLLPERADDPNATPGVSPSSTLASASADYRDHDQFSIATAESENGSVNGNRDHSDPAPGGPVSKRTEVSEWLGLAWPVCAALLCRTALGMTDVIMIGQYDSDMLAPVGIATMWCAFTMIVIVDAFESALRTMCSRAWGAKNFPLVGTWLHLGIFLSLFWCIPTGVAW